MLENPEDYEGYEDAFGPRPRGSGGGRKPSGKTSAAARAEAREAGVENRRQEARNLILKVIAGLDTSGDAAKVAETIDKYAGWVRASLETCRVQGGSFNISLGEHDPDVQLEFMRSGAHAGGQNVNKVSSAARAIHLPTGMVVRSDSSRDQFRNKALAVALLGERLTQHVKAWQVFMGDRNAQEVDRKLIFDLME